MRLLSAGALAVVVMAAGTLSPWRGSDDEPAVPTPRDLVGPVVADASIERTISALQERLRDQKDPHLLALLGLAYLQRARISADPAYYPKAESSLRASLGLQSDRNPDARLGMGLLALGRHDFVGALRWGRRALEAAPHDPDVRGVLVDALVELGRYQGAKRALQEMVDMRPDLASYARVSYLRELHGDASGALGAMRLARAAAGAADRAWVEHRLGELFFDKGSLRSARRAYQRSAGLLPDYIPARVGLAKVEAASGHLGSAARILSRVVNSYPLPEAVVLLGDAYSAMGRHGAAERSYDLVHAIDRLYRANGVNTDVELALFEADHGDPLVALDRATAEYERRQSVQVADALAWTLYSTGRYEAARRVARETLRLGTRSALFHFHAGMIDMRLGRLSSARAHLRRALMINPYFSVLHARTARRTLARL
ncbi:MAG: tetratricopeptide repeat protein [Actinomycetota bacterium]